MSAAFPFAGRLTQTPQKLKYINCSVLQSHFGLSETSKASGEKKSQSQNTIQHLEMNLIYFKSYSLKSGVVMRENK